MLIIIPNAFGNAPTNMGIDAALLQTIPSKTAIFRHYAWTEASVTFGYTQKSMAVKDSFSQSLKLNFCRRLTGGGIVDHRNDWTYSIILANDLATAQKAPSKIYSELHQAIQTALDARLIQTKLAPCPKNCADPLPQVPTNTSQCFVSASADDVLRTDGRKIAGAAIKRARTGLLLQGSIDRGSLPNDFNFKDFQADFIDALCSEWEINPIEPEDLRPLLNSTLIETEKKRFSSREWTEKR